MKVRVFYHDKCFDGASSAALFSRFYRERIRSDAEFEFTGLVHRAGALFDEKQFDGEENAIVDFKYSSSPRITWWFDHHESAFLSPSDAEHFEQDQSNRKSRSRFQSCTSFIAMIAKSAWPIPPVAVCSQHIDGALYRRQDCRKWKPPAMKLTMVIESAPITVYPQPVPLLATKLLAGLEENSSRRCFHRPKRHELSIDSRTAHRADADLFDVSDHNLRAKQFIRTTHPECVQAQQSVFVKVSVGSTLGAAASESTWAHLRALRVAADRVGATFNVNQHAAQSKHRRKYSRTPCLIRQKKRSPLLAGLYAMKVKSVGTGVPPSAAASRDHNRKGKPGGFYCTGMPLAIQVAALRRSRQYP